MAGPTSQQDKMAVHNSVDQKGDALSKAEGTWEDLSTQGFGKPLSKARSFESASKKKSGFQITRIIDRGAFHAGEDADSVDDLDDTCETRTEDVSSDILDLSKNTDIEADPSSSEETTPSFMTEEVGANKDLTAAAGSATVSNTKHPLATNQHEDTRQINNSAVTSGTADMQSRFKVVKIESKEPFRRGRWTCLDYLDPANVLEKPVDRTIEEEGSGNSSGSGSVQYVDQDLEPSPAPQMAMSGGKENQLVMDPTVYSQGQLPNGVEYSSYNPSLIQGGGAQQSMPPAQGPDPSVSQSFDTGASLPSTQQPQVLASQPMNASQSNVSQTQTSIPTNSKSLPAASTSALTPADFQPAPSSVAQSQTGLSSVYEGGQVAGEAISHDASQPSQVVPSSSQAQPSMLDYQSTIGAAASSASATDLPLQGNAAQPEMGEAVFMQSHDDGRPMESLGSESLPTNAAESSNEAERAVRQGLSKTSVGILTNQSFLSPPLLEMVSATAQQANPSKEDGEGESGASTVAIDNKIEQAMDLVKSHLMFAVREEVEVLKEQIKELLEKNSQLEYEINILKANASPETLQKLVNQSSQQPPTTSS